MHSLVSSDASFLIPNASNLCPSPVLVSLDRHWSIQRLCWKDELRFHWLAAFAFCFSSHWVLCALCHFLSSAYSGFTLLPHPHPSFLRWKLRSSIRELSSILTGSFNAINFPPSLALGIAHKLWKFGFYFIQLKTLILSFDLRLDPWLFSPQVLGVSPFHAQSPTLDREQPSCESNPFAFTGLVALPKYILPFWIFPVDLKRMSSDMVS